MTPEELHDVVGNMKGVNPHAKIIVTQNSKVDLKEVLGIGSFSIERSLEMVRALSSFFFCFFFFVPPSICVRTILRTACSPLQLCRTRRWRTR